MSSPQHKEIDMKRRLLPPSAWRLMPHGRRGVVVSIFAKGHYRDWFYLGLPFRAA